MTKNNSFIVAGFIVAISGQVFAAQAAADGPYAATAGAGVDCDDDFNSLRQAIMGTREEREDHCAQAAAGNAPYLIANDVFEDNVGKYKTAHAALPQAGADSIALIVGNGNVFSFLPEIHAKTLLMLDINAETLRSIEHVKQFINTNREWNEGLAAKLREELKTMFLNPYGENTKEKFTQDYNKNVRVLGDLHFLSSQKRYEQVRKSLGEKDVITIEIDLFNPRATSAFIEEVNKRGRVSYMNLTNAPDYDINSNMFKTLGELKMSDDLKIFITSLNNTLLEGLCPFKGVEVFKDAAFSFIFSTWQEMVEVMTFIHPCSALLHRAICAAKIAKDPDSEEAVKLDMVEKIKRNREVCRLKLGEAQVDSLFEEQLKAAIAGLKQEALAAAGARTMVEVR